MAFIPDVATGFGKFALGVAVATGADEAARVQAFSVNANNTMYIHTNFLLMFSLFLQEMGRIYAELDDFI